MPRGVRWAWFWGWGFALVVAACTPPAWASAWLATPTLPPRLLLPTAPPTPRAHPTQTPPPTATPTFRPTSSPTSTVWYPPTPSSTPTPALVPSLPATLYLAPVSVTRVVAYSPEEWTLVSHTGMASRLQHRTLPGCEVVFAQPEQWPAGEPHTTRIGGYPVRFYRGKAEDGRWWVLYQGWGDVLARVIAPESLYPACDAAFARLMTTLRLNADAQRACLAQRALPLRVGAQIRTRTHVYLRTEPRWAEATRGPTLPPDTWMTITGPPVCAIPRGRMCIGPYAWPMAEKVGSRRETSQSITSKP